jgi:hypothetical protein
MKYFFKGIFETKLDAIGITEVGKGVIAFTNLWLLLI